ncbi:LOW QUALITY PROTEIN: tripartite motif-containing protein 5 [Erethizon dorsatum]
MASSVLENVKEEVTCPICLELMTEPVSTDCGHSFCKLCITSNYESTEHEQGVSYCPVCRVTYQFENLRPSRHVASIVERLREVTLTPKAEHCALHGEKLLLFCREDGKVICWLCERSQEHRGHCTLLMEEAAQECREKLHEVLEKLMNDEEEFDKWKAYLERERTSWKNQIRGEIESVQAAFKNMRDTLDSEEKIQLQKLKAEEQGILNGLAESESGLTQQAQLVRELISDVQHRLQGSTVMMLQDVNATVQRSMFLTVKEPRTFPRTQRIVFQAPDLKWVLQSHQAHATLASSNNRNTADNQPVTVPVYPFGSLNMRGGTPGFSFSGFGRRNWNLGWVLSDGTYFKTPFNLSVPSSQPKRGYWVIGLQDKVKYNAFGKYPNSGSFTVGLSPTVPPCRIGDFLDYEAHTLSFYNVTDHGFLIYKFSQCSFSGNVFPFFSLGGCSEPMTLCGPSA